MECIFCRFFHVQWRYRMPYKSDKQRKYFNANRKSLEKQGVDVDEWNKESKGMKLPDVAKSGKSTKTKKAITKKKKM